MKHNREELAWSAGFADGEGCFFNQKIKGARGMRVHARFSVGQNDREVLDRFCAAVGFGKVMGPYKRKWSDWYNYQVNSFEQVQTLGALLWTFLSPIKREQFERVITTVTPTLPPGRIPKMEIR